MRTTNTNVIIQPSLKTNYPILVDSERKEGRNNHQSMIDEQGFDSRLSNK